VNYDSQLLSDLNDACNEVRRLSDELEKARNAAAKWEECADAFFACAGQNRTASWEQFEKAATMYQRGKGRQ
jgi:hypothetical protein